ncbi:MAG: ribosome silencing factor [Actinobacteria bacterium]|nr:ribosome silencing factor [Actinomycetota bacterium]
MAGKLKKPGKIKEGQGAAFKDTIGAVRLAARIADERKADYIKVLNVGPRLVITDYFVIIGAGNTRLTRRIAEDIEINLKKHGVRPIHRDGASEGNWILMDYDDFVVHVFTEEYRLYYDLERLWRDSKLVKVKSGGAKTAQIKAGRKKGFNEIDLEDNDNDINIDLDTDLNTDNDEK